LQDAGGDIVALVNVPFAHLPPGTSNRATVVTQWQYDAYGSVLSAESFAAPNSEPVPHLHAGHKGLFQDRLDGGVVDPIYNEDLPRLIPYAHTIYHVRNRAYQPAMGRWMQQDPNATAMSLIEAAGHSGRGSGRAIRASALSSTVFSFHVNTRYRDGMNVYEYLCSKPRNYNDPLGLNVWELGPSGGTGQTVAVGTAALAGVLILFLVDDYRDAMEAATSGTSAWMAGQLSWGETLFQSAENRISMLAGIGVMASSQSESVKKAQSLIDQAITHLLLLEDSVNQGMPQPPDHHHLQEIINFLRQTTELTKRMGRRTADEILRKAKDIETHARRSWELIEIIRNRG